MENFYCSIPGVSRAPWLAVVQMAGQVTSDAAGVVLKFVGRGT
jgi:hypothetical protein